VETCQVAVISPGAVDSTDTARPTVLQALDRYSPFQALPVGLEPVRLHGIETDPKVAGSGPDPRRHSSKSGSCQAPSVVRFEAVTPSRRTRRAPASVLARSSTAVRPRASGESTGVGRVRERVTVVKSA